MTTLEAFKKISAPWGYGGGTGGHMSMGIHTYGMYAHAQEGYGHVHMFARVYGLEFIWHIDSYVQVQQAKTTQVQASRLTPIETSHNIYDIVDKFQPISSSIVDL